MARCGLFMFLYVIVPFFLRIVDPCPIGLVRVVRSSLVCSIGGCLWLFTAVFVQFLRWLAFLGAVVYTYTALTGYSSIFRLPLTKSEVCNSSYRSWLVQSSGTSNMVSRQFLTIRNKFCVLPRNNEWLIFLSVCSRVNDVDLDRVN